MVLFENSRHFGSESIFAEAMLQTCQDNVQNEECTFFKRFGMDGILGELRLYKELIYKFIILSVLLIGLVVMSLFRLRGKIDGA